MAVEDAAIVTMVVLDTDGRRAMGAGAVAGEARPQYSAFSERVRNLAPEQTRCALMCGGARCRYERPQRWPPDQLALQGVYSHWITEDILAMARPSTTSIATWNLIQQFHSWGIRSVINLQKAGEHSRCGPPLESSGFTYDPNIFMNNNIYYYNFAWQDYSTCGLRSLLDAVKVLAFAAAEGRVAVHCHAGLGRTGVLVACYLVHAARMHADEAIKLVRMRREKAVQTAEQIAAVHHFERYLLPQTAIFSIKEPLRDRNKAVEFNLVQHLHRQRATLHGIEERAFKHLPKIIFFLCERLLKACECEEGGGGAGFCTAVGRAVTTTFLTTQVRKDKAPCEGDTSPSGSNALVLGVNADMTSALYCSMCGETYSSPPSSPKKQLEIDYVSNVSEMQLNVLTLAPTPAPSPIVMEINEEVKSVTPSRVAEALLIEHNRLSEDKLRYLREFQIDLNNRQAAINRINTEEDLTIVAALLFEWLEGLKMPVLDREDLATIVIWSEKITDCLQRLNLEDAILIEYLIRFIMRMKPLTREVRLSLLHRLSGALCQQGVRVRGVLRPSGVGALRSGTAATLVRFLTELYLLLQRQAACCSSCDKRSVLPLAVGKP